MQEALSTFNSQAQYHSVCVFGSGAIGSVHIQNLKSLGVKNIIVVDPAKKNLPSPSSIDFSVINAVLICTPTHTHTDIIRLVRSKKTNMPILCEKPLSHSYQSTKSILSEAPGVLSVAFVERFNRSITKLFSWYKKQTGPVKMSFKRRTKRPTENHWMLNSELPGSDILLDLGIHDIDIVLHMTGQAPVKITNHKSDLLSEQFSLGFPNLDEAVLGIFWDLEDDHPSGIENIISMESKKSKIFLDSNTNSVTIDGKEEYYSPRFEHAYTAEIVEFMNSIGSGRSNNFPSDTELLVASRCVEQIQKGRRKHE
jgi:predicted dehydrogenase